MVGFEDRALLQLSDPPALQALLAPAGAPLEGSAALIASVYDTDTVRLDTVTAIAVTDVRVQVPFFAARRHTGTWTRAQPYESTDVTVVTGGGPPVWADLLAHVSLRTVTEVDPGGIESTLTRGLREFTTLQEFRDQFLHIDLDAFMAHHRLATVEDLKEAYEYLVTEVHLRKPGVFDPADPANAHEIGFDLAVLVADGVALTTLLRAAATLREVADRTRVASKDALLGTARHALAVAAVLEGAALTAAGLTVPAVTRLLAREQVLCLVADPP
jgi:hypothetical protein